MIANFQETPIGVLIKLVLAITLTLVSTFAFSQPKAMLPGDYPDPTVIYADGIYYSIGTSSEWGPHFPIYQSTDLLHWKQSGFLFQKAPEWTQSSFWAAEYFYHKGLYYVYYSAKRKGDGVSCIGVATSKYPDRDFVDHGVVVDYGTESIDAFVVQDGNDLYMTWKAYGLDKRPIELLGSKMSDDGFRLEGKPFSLLMDTARVGIEGQSFVKKDGFYYMFYSAGACCGVNCDYHVQAVRAKTIKGPYERVGAPVLLGENADWKCMGHGTFVKGKGNQLYYLFHGYSKTGTTYTGREGLLATLRWQAPGEPVFTLISAPKEGNNDFAIDFRKMQDQQLFWQWDFRYASPQFTMNNNGLHLSGTYAADNFTGIALTWRPSSIVYQLEATIDLTKSSKAAEKGLVIYGDKDRAIGLTVIGNNLHFWRMTDGKKMMLQTVSVPQHTKHFSLKLSLSEGLRSQAYWKQDKEWKELVPANEAAASLEGLSPWDRSPRPGLLFKGDSSEKAVFTQASLSQ
ncbi:glycoside hydrolase family 43 protein [Sphingobacterium oryzagri]|uniref:Glycoside hydrolase family 43 protein n=1 Tax=Sphingobacterium oryzagri TaxID=3025669 RepID=A0ABY7WLM3_9SPHI|nr:glycoside hydrolase family 43 protein [Sphingobacterium sp. KACC 22765]WDF70058.1 glycoside hydrolase family 43 protein [Sphingobacterium sp. KACC 22765]